MHPFYAHPAPARIRAALWHTMLHLRSRTSRNPLAPPRALPPEQHATQAAALELLRAYLSGEVELDHPAGQTAPTQATGPDA